MNLKTLHKIGYGLYVVSSKDDKRFNGQIANTVFQITAEPPTIAVSINKQNLTHQFILESKVFTVSILSKEAPMEFIGHFGFKSGRELDKFKDVSYKVGVTGAPIVIENVLGYLEAELIDGLDVGTHTVFIAKVIGAEIIKDDEPMTYAYYHEIKRGSSPKTAPTYIREQSERIYEESTIFRRKIGENRKLVSYELPKAVPKYIQEEQKKTKKMEKYRCTVCGYVYDPEKGDLKSGIKPGTLFEELPNGWVCPVCGADKSAFEKVG